MLHILPIFLYVHVIHEVVKVMDVAWLSQSLASASRVSVSIPGQIGILADKFAFYIDCGGETDILTGLWCRNFHCTEVFIEQFPFYMGFGGENGILTGF
jgi:hypothetical protein